MRKFFYSLLILFTAGYVNAQTTIRGVLVDQADGIAIEYGSIALYSLLDSTLITGTVTQPDGTFKIENVKMGSYYIVAQFMGYNNQRINDIKVTNNVVVDVGKVSLSADQKMLDEIEVEGEKASTMHKIDRQVFSAGTFQSGQGGTATDVLRNLPSITVNGEGQITARGATGFVILINGKPVQSDAATILSQIPANAIQNVELITAPSAKYDPEGKAGIINIVTKQGETDGLFTQVNVKYGLPSIEDYDNANNPIRFGGDFVVNYRKKKWDLSFGGSYIRNDLTGKRVGDVSTIIADTLRSFPSEGERSFMEINYSGNFTLGYTLDKNNQFSLGFFAGKRNKERTADILYYSNRAVVSDGAEIYNIQYFNENLSVRRGDFVLGSIDYIHQFPNKSSITTSFLYEYTMLGGPTTNRNLGWPNTSFIYQDEYNSNDNPLHGSRLQVDYKFKPLALGAFEVGYQYRNLDHTGNFLYQRRNLATGNWELVPKFSSNVELMRKIHSVYGQLTGTKGKWLYGAGVRVEYMDRSLALQDKAGTLDTVFNYDFIKPFPSANIQYAVTENFKFKAAYSKRIERTTTFKMNPFPEREHSETLEQGDPELLPEFIDVVEAGFIKDFDQHSMFFNGYYRNVKNLVNRVNTIYTDTVLNRIYSNVGTARSLGFEAGVDLKPAKWWKVFAGGNLYQYNIEGTFANRPINSSSWIYSINANTTFTLSPTMSVQWSLNYISDRNTAQGEDSRFLLPHLTLRKSFMNERLVATAQWLNMDMGLLETNEQGITTWNTGEFYTTTNYVHEVDIIMINLSLLINKSTNKAKFIKSEFGEKEF